jgi:hypothetical protein
VPAYSDLAKLALLPSGDYCPIVRALAVLALLLQLQPLVGSALCAHDAEVARTECSMPHEQQPATGTLTAPDTGAPSACPSMGYCAPAASAVPKFAEQFQITSFVHGAPALMDRSMVPGEPLAPPFHPPRA